MRPGEETPDVRHRGRPSWSDLPRGELEDHWDARLDWTPARNTRRAHAALVALRDQAIPEGVVVVAREALIRRRAGEAQHAYDTARRAGDPQTIAEAKRKRDAAAAYYPGAEEVADYLAAALPSRPVGGTGEWIAAARRCGCRSAATPRDRSCERGSGRRHHKRSRALVRALAPRIAAAAETAGRSVGALLAKRLRGEQGGPLALGGFGETIGETRPRGWRVRSYLPSQRTSEN